MVTRWVVPAAAAAVICAGAVVCAAALGAAEKEADFLAVRERAIRTYGATPQPALKKLYQDTYAAYKETPTDALLFRAAAYAELADLRDQEEDRLIDVISGAKVAPGALLFAIETMRSHGTLTARIDKVTASLPRLDAAVRLDAAKALAQAFYWQAPPPAVRRLVGEEASARVEIGDLVFLAGAITSWGERDAAVKLLLDRAATPETGPKALIEIAAALYRLGAVDQARRVARDVYSKNLPEVSPEDRTLREYFQDREERLSRRTDLAGATGSWDMLLGATRIEGARPPAAAVLDRAVVLGAARLSCEEAEALRLLIADEDRAQSTALYGGVLVKAGDAYSAEVALVPALVGAPGLGDQAYLDLFDSVMALRDPATVLTFAGIYAHLFPEPQSARMMSEYTRALGDLKTSDRLFAIFVKESGLGPETRFNWEGDRLLALYYLDTGRLAPGKAAAMKAVDELLQAQAAKTMMRSSETAKFADLFERFGGVADLLERLRSREKDFPNSSMLLLLEEESLERLGRADEALALVATIHQKDNPVSRTLFLASTNARLGRWDEAIRLYNEATKADPKVPLNAYTELARLYAEAGRWDEAEGVLLKVAPKGGAAGWISAGALFTSGGQTQRGVRAYMMLDDLTMALEPEDAGIAVRALVDAGRIPEAARLLGRRMALQASFEAKARYITNSLPQASTAVAKYMALARALRAGPLATDAQLLSFFYSAVRNRAEALLDAETAFAAAGEAAALGPGNAEALAQLAVVADAWHAADARRAAEDALRKAPLAAIALNRIEAQLALGENDAARAAVGQLLSTPLSANEFMRLVDVAGEGALAADIVGDVASRSNESWPWTLHARVAEMALRAGARDLALSEAQVVASGGAYVGRAAWAAGFYAGAGEPALAEAAIAGFYRGAGPHPALAVLEADIDAARGDLAAAETVVTSARKTFARPPFSALFRLETARLSAAGPAAALPETAGDERRSGQ